MAGVFILFQMNITWKEHCSHFQFFHLTVTRVGSREKDEVVRLTQRDTRTKHVAL